MSTKVKNPNESGNGFIIAIVAVIAIVAAVIGVVLFMGRSKEADELAKTFPSADVSAKVALDGSVVEFKKDGADVPAADLYEDFSCHYCAQLDAASGEDALKAVNDGKIALRVHTLNFMDRDQEGHSTKAAAAFETIVKSGDAKLAWNYRTMLMRDQQKVFGWSNDQFADAAKAMGAPNDVVEKIKSGAGIADSKNSTAKNAESLRAAINEVSSPHVLLDGKEIDQNGWVETVAKKK